MTRRLAAMALGAALAVACDEAPPNPATNLRLPLTLTRIERPPEFGLERADVFVADAEADAVRLLQFRGASAFFLRGPAVFSATGISAPGYPTEIAAAQPGTGDRVFALAPGASVLHALQVNVAPFRASTADEARPPQIRIGTVVLSGDRDRFANELADPLRRAYRPPVVALQDAFPGLNLEGFTPVDLVVLDERFTDEALVPTSTTPAVVDSRLLVAFSRPGGPADGGARLVAFDVRTAAAGAFAASERPCEAWFEEERFGVLDEGVRGADAPRCAGDDLGAIAIDTAAGFAVADVGAALRHLEPLFDGSVLATDTATMSVARQYAPSRLDATPDIVLTASIAVGGSVHRAVAYGDEGAVVLRSDRAALVALDCRAGPCQRVEAEFPQLRSFGDTEASLDVPPGVLLLRQPSAVTGAFGREDADGEPLQLFDLRAATRYRVFPIEGRDRVDGAVTGGVLSLVHEDALATFVVGAIDDLRVATLDGVFGSGRSDDVAPLVPPEPRVEQVLERRVIVQGREIYPGLESGTVDQALEVLEPRTRIGGAGCLRPQTQPNLGEDSFQAQLAQAFGSNSSTVASALSALPDDFLGCFPDTTDFTEGFVPRQVRNRFDLERSPPQQDDCDIEADPVLGNTTYRATYRGPVLRAGGDVEVNVVDESEGRVVLDLQLPTDLDRFDVTEDDVIDLHLRCLTPTEENANVFEDQRTELTIIAADITAVGRQNLIVEVNPAEIIDFWAPRGLGSLEFGDDGQPEGGWPDTFVDVRRRFAGVDESARGLGACAADVETGRREVLVFDLEVYPAEGREVAVLTRESDDGVIFETFARCPVENGVVRFDTSCAPELPVRFAWEAVSAFECRQVLPPDPNDLPPDDGGLDDEDAVSARELGRPCTSSRQCGAGRTCAGRAGPCPGQCAPACVTNACFARWRQRACDSVELRVNGARPLQVDLTGSTDRSVGAVIPGDSVFVPEARGFLHSFPGARIIRRVRLGSESARSDAID